MSGAVIFTVVVLLFVFRGQIGGDFVFTGQLKGVFQELFNREKPDRIIWLDESLSSSADYFSTEENTSVSKKEKLSPIKFCSFSSIPKSLIGSVVINEVAWMGTVGNSDAEWLELKNISSSPVSLAGYQIIDKAEQIKVVFAKDVILPAGGFYVLARENQGVSAEAFYSGILSNSNEGLRLFDKDCNLIDGVLADKNWPGGDNTTKKTMERDMIGLWQTSLVVDGTLGRENSVFASIVKKSEPVATATSALEENLQKISEPILENNQPETSVQENQQIETSPVSDDQFMESNSEPIIEQQPAEQVQEQRIVLKPVLISEIMAGKDGNSNFEFIELWNPNNEIFDLTGWSLKKKTSAGTESTLVSATRLEGKKVPANDYFLLTNEVGYDGGVAPDVAWPKSYTLAYTNNSILLYDSNNQKTEEVGWSEIPKDKSYERRSVDGNEFFVQDSPNPQNSQ